MASIGELTANLALSTAAYTAGLQSAAAKTSSFVGSMVRIAAPLGAAFGLQHVLEAAGEQIRAEKKLDSVLRSTGNAAGLSGKEIKDFAADLQKTTNFADETTISAAGVLATFTQIKGDQFKGAITAAQDLSTIMGQDLQTSIVQIGKALNDPIKGVNALRRVGVSFTQEQMAQIKALQQSGDVMGAQNIILKELGTEFGGAAQALASPMKQAGNMVNDLAENLGMVLGPILKEGAKAFMDLIGPIADSREQFQQAGQDLAALGKFMGEIVGSVLVPFGQAFYQAGQLIVGAYNGGKVSAQDFANVGMLAADNVTLKIMEMFPSTEKTFTQIGLYGAATWDFLATYFAGVWENIKSMFFTLVDVAKAAGSAISAAFTAAMHLENPITAAGDALQKGMETVVQGLGKGMQDPMQIWTDSVKNFEQTFKNASEGIADQGGMKKAIEKQRDQVKSAVASTIDALPKTAKIKTPEFKGAAGVSSVGGPAGKEKKVHQEKLKAEVRGSKEDLSSIVEAMGGGAKNHAEETAKNTQSMVEKQDETNELLEDLADEYGLETYDLLGG